MIRLLTPDMPVFIYPSPYVFPISKPPYASLASRLAARSPLSVFAFPSHALKLDPSSVYAYIPVSLCDCTVSFVYLDDTVCSLFPGPQFDPSIASSFRPIRSEADIPRALSVRT